MITGFERVRLTEDRGDGFHELNNGGAARDGCYKVGLATAIRVARRMAMKR